MLIRVLTQINFYVIMSFNWSENELYHFSGTGNTYFVAQKLKNHLEELGNSVAMFSCENVQEIDMDCDMVGIVFPIHAPVIFSQFLDRFPQQTHTPLFGIITSGYVAGDMLDYETKTKRIQDLSFEKYSRSK